MKITKHLIALCVFCCAAATPVCSYYQRDITSGLSREFSKGFDKIVELMITDSDTEPLIKEMAIQAFEKRIAKDIQKKQKSITRSLERIDSQREWIKEIRAGEYDHWNANDGKTIEQRRQDLENDRLEEIENILKKISKAEKDIVQYTEFQNRIKALKNGN